MDQELMTILQNIKSLISQAEMAAGGSTEGGDEVTPDMLEKFLKAANGEDEGSPMDDAEDKKEDVEKSDDKDKDDKMVEKSDLGPNASDKAEERFKDNDPETEANIKEVAKAIAEMLIKKSALAKKEVKKSNDMADLLKVVKSLTEEVVEQKKAMNGLLEGLGISEQLTAAPARVEKAKPMNSLQDIKKSIEAIEQMSGKQVQEIDKGIGDSSHYLAKSLAENPSLLAGIFSRNAKR